MAEGTLQIHSSQIATPREKAAGGNTGEIARRERSRWVCRLVRVQCWWSKPFCELTDNVITHLLRMTICETSLSLTGKQIRRHAKMLTADQKTCQLKQNSVCYKVCTNS